MGDERALVTMSEAIDALERAGNLRAAAVARRDLGSWRLADGDPAGVDDLGAALPTLLRTDRQAAGPALAEIAATVAATEPERAARLAGAARHVMLTAPGTRPASLEQRRLWSLADRITREGQAAAGAGAELDDEALVRAGRRSTGAVLSGPSRGWPDPERRLRRRVRPPPPPIWCQVLHPAPAKPSHQSAITNR